MTSKMGWRKEFVKTEKYKKWLNTGEYTLNNMMLVTGGSLFELSLLIDESIESLKENHTILDVQYIHSEGDRYGTKNFSGIIRFEKIT